MQKISIWLFIIFFCLFGHCLLYAAGITLTRIPEALNRPDISITIQWLEPIEAKMKFGTSSGQYAHETKASGNRSLSLIPQNEGMTPGVYYCIIAAGSLTSSEFKLMIESPKAAIMQAPINNAVITTSTPVFRWDEVPGVPFYHLILSDQEVTIREDENGELQLASADIIWQVITSNTSITYGDPDPSGFFAAFNGTVPPLMEGFEYNWIVLNNYNNHPAYASTVQAGVSSFRVNLDVALNPPALISPVAKANLSQANITFQWSPVVNANAYQVLLSETRVQDGSESSYLIWRPITTENLIEFPARFLLKNAQYFWRVVALDLAGQGVSSDFRPFGYRVPSGKLKIQTLKRGGSILPRVEITLAPKDGSTENSRLLTPDGGVLNSNVQPGSYMILAVKESYADTSATVSIGADDSLDVRLTLRPLVQSLSGRVVDKNAQVVAGAQVTFDEYQKGIHKQLMSDAGGNFRLGLVPGTWYISAIQSGYQPSDTLAIPLKYGENKSLPQNLVLTENLARLVGKVTSNSGIPIINARVLAESKGLTQIAFTDYSGRFNLQLGAGEWRVWAEKSGFSPSSMRVLTLTRGETRALTPDITLNTNFAIITGFVYSTSTPLAGARVQATPLTGPAIVTTTGPKGGYVLSLPPADYAITASLSGYVAQQERFIQLTNRQTLPGMDILMEAASGFIKGFVLRNGAPIKGARVVCEQAADTTHADGSYLLAVLPGKHLIQAYYRGLLSPGFLEIPLDRGETKENVNFNMSGSAGVVAGKIYSDGKPICAADITAKSGPKEFYAESGPDGNYWLSLPPGIWDCSAKKVGFAGKTLTGVAVNSGQAITGVDFDLAATQAILKGTISDSKNRKLKTAAIHIGGTNKMAISDRLGNYAVALDPGAYPVIAEKTGFVSQQKSISLTPNNVQILDFSLPIKGIVRGVIRTSSGRSLDDIMLMATSSETLKTRSDHAGEYWLYLNAGNYQLVADQLGYAANTITFSISLGDTLERNFTLMEAPQEIAYIAGKMTDSKNQPLGGVAIRVLSDERQIIYTEYDGSYRTGKLATGKNFNVKPFASGRFFVPAEYNYKPLVTNQGNQSFVSGLYGDVSSNELIGSFDGSLILRIRAEQDVSPYYRNLPRDSIAADVSGNREVSPFDASLIFRYAVGLINKFPADQNILLKPAEIQASERLLAFEISDLQSDPVIVDLSLDDASDIYACEITLLYDPEALIFSQARMTSITEAGQLMTGDKPGRLKLVYASTYSLEGVGSLFRIVFNRKQAGNSNPGIKIVTADFNEHSIPVKIVDGLDNGNLQFKIFDNYPNPFNAATVIRYTLPALHDASGVHRVHVAIYNVLGQCVRTLVEGSQSPGPHQIIWDGRDALEREVPSGMYFYRIQAGACKKSKKLLLIR